VAQTGSHSIGPSGKESSPEIPSDQARFESSLLAWRQALSDAEQAAVLSQSTASGLEEGTRARHQADLQYRRDRESVERFTDPNVAHQALDFKTGWLADGWLCSALQPASALPPDTVTRVRVLDCKSRNVTYAIQLSESDAAQLKDDIFKKDSLRFSGRVFPGYENDSHRFITGAVVLPSSVSVTTADGEHSWTMKQVLSTVVQSSKPPGPAEVISARVRRGVNLGEACDKLYPPASRRAGEEGSVVLLVHVAADGWVREAKIESSSGYPRLDAAAIQCIQGDRYFEPQKIDGMPADSWQRMKWAWRVTS
jgi:protein TonB